MSDTGDGARKALAGEIEACPLCPWPGSELSFVAGLALQGHQRDMIVAALRTASSGTVTREEVARALFDHNDKKYIHRSKWDDANSYVKDQWLELADVALSLPSPAVELREALIVVNRLLIKIANLIDDEDTCDPLDDAIKWANEALTALASLPAKSVGDTPLDARTVEACAKIAKQTALRCVREKIRGDSVALFIEQQIRALLREDQETQCPPSNP